MPPDFDDYMPKQKRSAAAPEFRIERKIATGGMGSIYQVYDVRIQRRVALKALRPDRVQRRENVLRFVREARLTAQLQHPNIVPVHYFGEDEDGLPFYIMKLVKGESLEDMIHRMRQGDTTAAKAYPLARLLTIFLKVCDAIAYAHARDIIHRDLKPDNIMLGDFGEVLVMDWGLAKEIGERAATPATTEADDLDTMDEDEFTADQQTESGGYETFHTMPGVVLGSPNYMAPEQVAGQVMVDPRTDIYGLGGVLYCLLTLYPPHASESLEETKMLQETGNIPPPAAFNPKLSSRIKGKLFGRSDVVFELPHCPGGSIPEPLSNISMKALSSDPEQRYQSVAELQAELTDFLQQGKMLPMN